MGSNLVFKRGLSVLSDATLVFLLVLLTKIAGSSHLSSSPFVLVFWAALLTPILNYLQVRFVGQSFGHWLTGIRRVTRNTRKRPYRFYDWLFSSEVIEDPHGSLPLPIQVLGSTALLFLAAGILFYAAAQDPVLRSLKVRSIPLYAPSPGSAAWRVTPWYYVSGAWPVLFNQNPVLYSLPYERGPPDRFVGKIQSYWGKSGVRVTLVGPLTVRGTSSRQELRECFTEMFGCTALRKEVYERPLAPFTRFAELEKAQWISVENPLLNEEERPEGLYLVGKARNGEIVEGYFLINSRMTVQGFLLYRYDNEEGAAASRILQNAVGSLRMTTDLKAATAWVNQSLSKMDLRKAGDAGLLEGQGLLLSKVSVDPLSLEPFYYIAGTAYQLFKNARERRDLEAASSAKSMIVSALRYAKDIAPNDPRIKEMELIKAQVEKF